MMQDMRDEQVVELISSSENCVKQWRDYNAEERAMMENGTWYLLSNVEAAEVLCVVM